MPTHSCGARWGGDNACHCARCHTTYSGLTNFDKHRTHEACLAPTEVGCVEVRPGVWGTKMSDEQRDRMGW